MKNSGAGISSEIFVGPAGRFFKIGESVAPMSVLRIFLHTYLYVPYGFRKLTGTGSFGRNGATVVNEQVPEGGTPLKRALWQHHVKQYHEASCSVASVVSVVNAIRVQDNDRNEPIGQMDILEKVRTANWKERMSGMGHNGKRGLPLPVLGAVVKSSLDAYGISYMAVETVQASKRPGLSRNIRAILRSRLEEFESSGNGLIIAHFDQGAYVRALNIPHISPVGAFDAGTGQVTILDVDAFQQKPYRVGFDTFYRGLASDYHHMFRPFGYGSGGYVYIKLGDRQRVGQGVRSTP